MGDRNGWGNAMDEPIDTAEARGGPRLEDEVPAGTCGMEAMGIRNFGALAFEDSGDGLRAWNSAALDFKFDGAARGLDHQRHHALGIFHQGIELGDRLLGDPVNLTGIAEQLENAALIGRELLAPQVQLFTNQLRIAPHRQFLAARNPHSPEDLRHNFFGSEEMTGKRKLALTLRISLQAGDCRREIKCIQTAARTAQIPPPFSNEIRQTAGAESVVENGFPEGDLKSPARLDPETDKKPIMLRDITRAEEKELSCNSKAATCRTAHASWAAALAVAISASEKSGSYNLDFRDRRIKFADLLRAPRSNGNSRRAG
jgi:hypothetical protein